MKTPPTICFGLTEELDRESFANFLLLAGNQKLAKLLASRLSSAEITQFTDAFMVLLRKHLSSQEYHEYFLQEAEHSTGSKGTT